MVRPAIAIKVDFLDTLCNRTLRKALADHHRRGTVASRGGLEVLLHRRGRAEHTVLAIINHLSVDVVVGPVECG